jgi:hypothetical protein
MNKLSFLLMYLLCSQMAHAELSLPPDITAGIRTSQVGESGGFFVRGVDREVFFDYMRKHWREIADDIESLPKAERSSASDEVAWNVSVINFGAACEWLPPLEYVDFMDKFLELREQKRIGFLPFQLQMSASCKKQDFLDVNWEHPRVKAIFEKARKLTPSSETAFLASLDAAAKGELADNYKTNMAHDAPLPETLPGIKLKRPWASLIKKYEALTGKKLPPDPEWDPRPTKRGGTQGDLAAIQTESQRNTRIVWPWLASGVALLAALSFIWKARRKRRITP